MFDITVILMFIMAFGLTVILTVFVVALFRSAHQAEKKAANPAASTSGAPSSEAAAPSWAPPRYEAAPSMAAVSLRVGLSLVQPRQEALLVSWNAVNDGGEPVMVLWGAPEVRLDRAGGVQLRYAYSMPESGDFAPPDARLCAPGEIISRTITLPAPVLGGSVQGIKLSLVVGYGPAAAYDTACGDPSAYEEWQQLAVSTPRSVPAR